MAILLTEIGEDGEKIVPDKVAQDSSRVTTYVWHPSTNTVSDKNYDHSSCTCNLIAYNYQPHVALYPKYFNCWYML